MKFRMAVWWHFSSVSPILKLACVLVLLLSTPLAAKIIKVFHNTLDPAVFGTAGGAHLINAKGEGHVNALTICVRFQECMQIVAKVAASIWNSNTTGLSE